jgi:hypothetical protein
MSLPDSTEPRLPPFGGITPQPSRTRFAGRPRCQDVDEAVIFDEDTPTDDLIATERKRKDLRSEMILVERLIVQAERRGDEEVTRKLFDYRAKLKHELGL